MTMSKFETYTAYPKDSLLSAEAALLTIWRSLRSYHNDIVLVGGLAVHYLTQPHLPGLPGAVTVDVDFGITLGACGGQYGTIRSDLSGLGFEREGARLVRKVGHQNLYVDFLTEDPPAISGARTVDDVTASVIPGINRALACRRWVQVRGRDVYGAPQSCPVAVADIGPLLVLKLNAFGGPTGRRLPKDAYDVLLAVTGFIEGPEAAVQAFRAEAMAENPGHASAVLALRSDFCHSSGDGPTRAAEFTAGNAEDRARIRQSMVTVAEMLLDF